MPVAETSIAAFVAALPNLSNFQSRVLRVIRDAGEYGATDEEVESILGCGQTRTNRPTRNSLVKGGLVSDSGRRRETVSGRQAIVWIFKAQEV